MRKPFYTYEIDDYFHRSLKDLGWKYPSERESLIRYAQSIAKQIVSKEILTFEGSYKMYSIARHLQFPPELVQWLYLDEEITADEYRSLSDEELELTIINEARNLVDKNE